MSMPLAAFWSFNKQVDRLRAEEDQRTLQLLAAAQSPEGVAKTFEALRIELDGPVVIETFFDAEKFKELKSRFRSN